MLRRSIFALLGGSTMSASVGAAADPEMPPKSPPSPSFAPSFAPDVAAAVPVFPTMGAAASARLPATTISLRTEGFLTPGDGGWAFYRRSRLRPGHNLWFADTLGTCWVLNPLGGGWNARQCGARGDGSTDDTAALQNALNFFALIDGERLRPVLHIPAGDYRHSGLTIGDLYGHGSLNRGLLTIQGDGPGSTRLTCCSPSGSAMTIASGNVTIRGLRLTSDGLNRSKNRGAGHGIKADVTEGGRKPASNNITRVALEDLVIDQQPEDGIHAFQIELWSVRNSQISNCGGNGVTTRVSSSTGGVTVGCIFETIRVYRCGAGGIDSDLNNSAWINVETLQNAGPVQWRLGGSDNVLINPDVECDQTGADDNLYGLKLSGSGNIVQGGVFYGQRKAAILVLGSYSVIVNPTIDNPAAGYAATGVLIDPRTLGQDIRVRAKRHRGVTTMIEPPQPETSWRYQCGEDNQMGILRQYPGPSVAPVLPGEVCMEFTNATTLTFRGMGSDGIVRSGAITLS